MCSMRDVQPDASARAQAHNISVQPAPAGSLVAALSGWLDKGLNKLIGGSDLPSSASASLAEAERRAASEPGSPRGVRAHTCFRVLWSLPRLASGSGRSRRLSGAPRQSRGSQRGVCAHTRLWDGAAKEHSPCLQRRMTQRHFGVGLRMSTCIHTASLQLCCLAPALNQAVVAWVAKK